LVEECIIQELSRAGYSSEEDELEDEDGRSNLTRGNAEEFSVEDQQDDGDRWHDEDGRFDEDEESVDSS